MARIALLALLVIPSLAGAFEAGDQVVCTRRCEVQHGDKWEATFHAGDPLVVAADQEGQVRIRKMRGTLPADHLVAPSDAVAHFRERIARDPGDVEARCGLAVSLVRTAANEALAEASEAVRRQENWLTLRSKALVHWGRPGESQQAMALLDRLIRDEPKRLELRVLRAGFLVESGQDYKVINDDTFVLKHAGPLSYVLQHRGAAWLMLGESRKALADYESALALDPDDDDCAAMNIGLKHWEEPEIALWKLAEFLAGKPKTSSAWFLRGWIHREQKQYAEAIDAFTRAVGIQPNHVQALACRAQCPQDLELALANSAAVLDLQPHNARLWSWRGYLFKQSGKSDLAVEDFSAAIRLQPEYSWYYRDRGEIYQMWAEYHLAAADFEAAARIEGCDSRTLKLLAYLYATCPDPTIRDGEAALRIIQRLEKEDGAVAGTCLREKAAAYAAIGQFEAAIETQRKSSSKVPPSAGGSYGPQPQIEVQRDFLSPAVKEASAPDRERLARYEAGKPYLTPARTVPLAPAHKFEPGDRVVCIRTCETVQDGKPQGLVLAGQEWTVKIVDGDQVKYGDRWIPADHVILKPDAVAFLRKQLENDPDDVELHSALALQLVETAHDAALAEAQEAVKRHASWFTLLCKAKVQRERGEWASAMSTVNEAVDKFPDRLELYEFRAPLAANTGAFRKAVDDYSRILKRDATETRALVGRGLSYSQLKQTDQALADFDAAIKLKPDDISVHLYRCAAFIPAERFDEAVAGIDAVLQRDPENFAAYEMQGTALYHKRDFAQAIEALTRATERDHSRAGTFAVRAACWLQMGERELALADCSKAIELAPRNDDGWGIRGVAHQMRGDYDLALADLNEAIRLSPEDPKWHLGRASVWQEQGDFHHAIEELQTLHTRYPKFTDASAALAMLYATCPDDKVRDGRKARDLVSNSYYWSTSVNHDVAESLAAAYAELGDFPKAIRVQQKALTAADDPQEERTARERLELYEAGKPYRGSVKRR